MAKDCNNTWIITRVCDRLFLSAFDKGDRVAIASPGYPAYFNSMLALGIIPQLLPARASENWKPDLEALVANGDIPDGLLLASPANPTGVVIRDVELEAVCRWCDQHGVRLIMDEIYHGLFFRGRAQSALAFTDNAIIVNSFSKYFCMTGWRLGWVVFRMICYKQQKNWLRICIFQRQR